MAKNAKPKSLRTQSGSKVKRQAKKPSEQTVKRPSVKSTTKLTKKQTTQRVIAPITPKSTTPKYRASTRLSTGIEGSSTAASHETPQLLSGGNPQIKKADGDAPVQAYIAAMPGWKHDVGKRLDTLIERTLPGVRKAVKWNSPFYGAPDQRLGWFLAFHCITKYVKVAFFKGSSLTPLPPGTSKQQDVRYLDIYEGDLEHRLDETQLALWIRQAAAEPGVEM